MSLILWITEEKCIHSGESGRKPYDKRNARLFPAGLFLAEHRERRFTCSAGLFHGQFFEKERELAQLNQFDLAVLLINNVQKPICAKHTRLPAASSAPYAYRIVTRPVKPSRQLNHLARTIQRLTNLGFNLGETAR
jgi:hypothetical protein